jgi:hypothetical protein
MAWPKSKYRGQSPCCLLPPRSTGVAEIALFRFSPPSLYYRQLLKSSSAQGGFHALLLLTEMGGCHSLPHPCGRFLAFGLGSDPPRDARIINGAYDFRDLGGRLKEGGHAAFINVRRIHNISYSAASSQGHLLSALARCTGHSATSYTRTVPARQELLLVLNSTDKEPCRLTSGVWRVRVCACVRV